MTKSFVLLLMIFLQTTSFSQTVIESDNNEYLKKEDKKYDLMLQLDSLFRTDSYSAMLRVCSLYDQKDYEDIVLFNRIAAYYFSGDSIKAFRIIDSFKNAAPNARYLTRIMFGNSLAYKRFLQIGNNKKFVLKAIKEKYKAEVPGDLENGYRILMLFINDQWIRFNSTTYIKVSKLNPSDTELLSDKETGFLKRQSTDAVYQFYKSVSKFFTKSEVKSLYNMQTLMFFHDFDLKHRAYYAMLMEAAVKQDSGIVNSLINFKIATELYKKFGDKYLDVYLNLKTQGKAEKIIDKYRKLYHKPNYFWNPIN